MDPYLEAPAYWSGFHTNLYLQIQLTLNRTMPEGYYAEIDEYVWLQPEESDKRILLGKPDTFVARRKGAQAGSGTVGDVAVIAPPVTVTLPKARKRSRRFVKVVAPDGATVVSVIEVLSPSNKGNAEDRKKYLEKRAEYFATGTNLVEIDLLRGGDRMPLGRPSPPAADYYVFVCRGKEYPRADVWPFTIRDPIPAVPVPLKPEHPDVPLDLQACVTEIYDTQRYAGRVDYTCELTPSLREADATWAAERLKSRATK
jgi:hypothetical protein